MDIVKEIADFYDTLDKKELIDRLYEKLDDDSAGIIISINFPIHMQMKKMYF